MHHNSVIFPEEKKKITPRNPIYEQSIPTRADTAATPRTTPPGPENANSVTLSEQFPKRT